MNTEQQLRERAEAILNSHEIIFNGSIQKMKVTQAMIDFHKQEQIGDVESIEIWRNRANYFEKKLAELQRIGEAYVPVSVEKDLPTDDAYYFVEAEWNDREVKQIGRYDSNERGWTCETKNTKPTHWLKKLPLLEVKNFDV